MWGRPENATIVVSDVDDDIYTYTWRRVHDILLDAMIGNMEES